jgi:hypothetical protein
MRYLPFLLLVALVVYTVVDVVNADEDERLGVHPALWVLGIVLLPPLGSIAWLAVRFSRRRPGPSRPQPRGPLAPDDDPEFLWRLEQERRRREQEKDPEA